MSNLRSLTLKLAARYPVGSTEWKELPERVASAWQDNYLRRSGEGSTFHFRNKAMQDLWNDALMGQISDGMWENAANTGWLFWANLKESVGGATKIEGGIPSSVRKSFNFLSRDMIEIIGDQMLSAVQKSEPQATMGQTIKYVQEIMTAMKGGVTLEAPAGEGAETPAAMPDAQSQIHEHRRMLFETFDAAKVKFNASDVYGEAFSFASTGSRAGQYHYFIIISNLGWYTVVSAYGKLGKPPKAVVLGAKVSLSDALKLVHNKVKSKLSSGYDISNLNGITKLLDPISGRAVRQTITASSEPVQPSSRESSDKFAADIRGILSQVFSSFQPYVRNWQSFLMDLSSDLSGWETTWGGGWSGVPSIALGEHSWSEGKLVGGYGSRIRSQQWDPPEYDEQYVDAAETGSMELKASLDLRLFPKTLTHSLASNISDKAGFFKAAQDLAENREARTMLAKLLRAATMKSLKNGEASDAMGEIFFTAAERLVPHDHTIDYTIPDTQVGEVKFSFSGTSIEVSAAVTVTFEVENVTGPEPYFETPDSY